MRVKLNKMDKVERTIEENEGKVYAVTKTESLVDDRKRIRFLKEELSLEAISQYISDDLEQSLRFNEQKKSAQKRIKELKKAVKPYISERGYKTYKKNFNKYENFEFLIEKGVEEYCAPELKEELEKYKKQQDKYKSFYITKQQEKELEDLENNLEAYGDIEDERKLFLEQMKEAKRLLSK